MRIDLGVVAVSLGRRPWTGLGTAWLACLLGWAVLLLPLVTPPPPSVPPPSAVVVGALPPRPEVVRLQADLAWAQGMAAEVRSRLAAMPPTLTTDGGGGIAANPLRARLLGFQAAQDRLITTLGRRLAAAGQAPTALESAAPTRWAAALLRPALPLLVLAIGAGLGLAVVGWRTRRDGVIAGVAQLQRAVQLPVLGQVAIVPAGGARAWDRLCAGPQLGWAGLLAVWTMVTVITVVVGSGPVGAAIG